MRIPEGLFSANVACQVAHVTHRMLDYWVRTAVVEPTRVFECDYDDRGDKRRKAYNLFDFAALVQIKIVKDLRDSGVGLQRIRFAIGRLRATWGKSWQSVWLVTDGRSVFEATDDPGIIRSLAKKDKGQL